MDHTNEIVHPLPSFCRSLMRVCFGWNYFLYLILLSFESLFMVEFFFFLNFLSVFFRNFLPSGKLKKKK
jgi:hypothetical protein